MHTFGAASGSTRPPSVHSHARRSMNARHLRDPRAVIARSSPDLIATSAELIAQGVTRGQIAGELGAGRWRRAGHALVLHNGPLSTDQGRRVAQIHGGPAALLTTFTAAEIAGLRSWERVEVHLLCPAGTRLRGGCPVPIALHSYRRPPRRRPGLTIEALPDALVRAAGTFSSPRPACGLLAAGVQQRLTTPPDLADALERFTRVRHRAVLIATIADIAGGSQALSEIDFVRLCRRHHVPEPDRQLLRRDSSGRRRYLDATWRRADGRLIVVEVDGALHLAPRAWWNDQHRQNELALADALVLRFPSVVVRTDPAGVLAQLRRALYP